MAGGRFREPLVIAISLSVSAGQGKQDYPICLAVFTISPEPAGFVLVHTSVHGFDWRAPVVPWRWFMAHLFLQGVCCFAARGFVPQRLLWRSAMPSQVVFHASSASRYRRSS